MTPERMAALEKASAEESGEGEDVLLAVAVEGDNDRRARRAATCRLTIRSLVLEVPTRRRLEMATIWLAMAKATDKGSSKQTEAAELLYRAPRRLQRDMEAFLALEDEWLPYRLWVVAGKKKLYERALKHGTPAEWGNLLGLQLRSRSQRTAREREARVERELRRLLREHRFESMPSLATWSAPRPAPSKSCGSSSGVARLAESSS